MGGGICAAGAHHSESKKSKQAGTGGVKGYVSIGPTGVTSSPAPSNLKKNRAH